MPMRARVFLWLTLAACMPASAGSTRALLIGVSNYGQSCKAGTAGCNNLEGPRNDVKVLARILRERWKLADSDVRTLVDGQAHRAAILQEIDTLASSARAGETVLIYFSGHGTGPENGGERFPLPSQTAVLIASPAPGARPDTIDQYVIGREHLRPRLARLDATGATVLFVADACYSQFAVKSAPSTRTRLFRAPANLEAELARRIAVAPSPAIEWPYRHVIFFAAASANETAVDVAGPDLRKWPTLDGEPHGAFTDALLRVMTGQPGVQDVDGDGQFSYGEVFNALSTRLMSLNVGHIPQRLPLSAASDTQRLVDAPFMGDRQPTTGTPPASAEPVLTVAIESATKEARALSTRLAQIPGVRIVTESGAFRVRPAGSGLWRFLGADCRPIHESRFGTDSAELIDWFSAAARLERLRIATGGPELELHLGAPGTGSVVRANEPASLSIRPNEAVAVRVLHLMGDGSRKVWTGFEPDFCPVDRVPAGANTQLCSWGSAKAPFGRDTLYVVAADSSAAPLPRLTPTLDEAGLAALETYVAQNSGHVRIAARTIYTVPARRAQEAEPVCQEP